jgi:hypothetical protein
MLPIESLIINSNHKGQVNLVFAISPFMSALSTPSHEHILAKKGRRETRLNDQKLNKSQTSHPEWANLGTQRNEKWLNTIKQEND